MSCCNEQLSTAFVCNSYTNFIFDLSVYAILAVVPLDETVFVGHHSTFIAIHRGRRENLVDVVVQFVMIAAAMVEGHHQVPCPIAWKFPP